MLTVTPSWKSVSEQTATVHLEDNEMKVRALIFVIAIACATAIGCSETECDKASDKLDECGLPSASAGFSGGACSGVSRCEADCINAYSCAEIVDALNGTPNNYSNCDDACQ